MTRLRSYRRIHDRFVAKCHHPRSCDYHLVRKINSHFAGLSVVNDSELASRAMELRERVEQGVPASDGQIVIPAFALVKEAARRTLNMTHYDQQLLAGISLASGSIAEMQTGEGKTLSSTLPVFLNAISGKGVHVTTVNSYLAQRDVQQLRQVYELLGLTVGHSKDGASNDEKRVAYNCDITYATGYEVGFDYLCDEVNRRERKRQPLGRELRSRIRGDFAPSETTIQRPHAFAIVDEIDSVLIDEAMTPLILSETTGDVESPSRVYRQAARMAEYLTSERDFVIDSETGYLSLTLNGLDSIFAVDNPTEGLARSWSIYVEQALRAKHLYQQNVHYIVRNDQIQIVDGYTGRVFSERHWRDGLHQAIETKESVTVTAEKRSIARISRQRYFQMYRQTCGMTGTATGHESELFGFYRLPIVVIPLRKPSRREQLPTCYFADAEAKWKAIVKEIEQRHRNGQPVLVGTRTIANSHLLAERLNGAGLPFHLLNGVQDEDEAHLIAEAGQHGAITIATNMAGRGTDIKPSAEAIQAGGLHVIAAERHDSRRIDRQLIGRTARQGDPGTCRFFVSAADDLIQRFDPSLATKMKQSAQPDGTCNANFDDAICRIQANAERENYARRRKLMQQELWLNEVLNTMA